MSEYDDYYWTENDGVTRPSRFSFSLGTLLRFVTLLCLALGWLALVRFTPPDAVQAVLVSIVGVMAVVVGVRCHGRTLSRVLAAVWFFGLGLVIAVYSALTACVLQLTAEDNLSRWDGLGQTIGGGALVLVLPIVVVSLTFMARAWTWSTYDSSLQKQD